MSTELQRYSIENQAAAIAAYALDKNLTIVRTYRDEGLSGLKIKGRKGLIGLIDDIESGRADFDHVLVYDVSRWGRFQDIDESAHYEFVCRKNGVRVAYCAEQFDNDGSLVSSVVKNIKRVMAAEFSRELSVKVHAGQCRLAGLGFRVGGPVGFGLRREMVDETGCSKGNLKKGQHKSLKTDHVKLRRGTDEEAETVRWIFRLFVIARQSETEIARRLDRMGVANTWAMPWSAKMVDTILRNENYIGNLVYNRTSRRLGQKEIRNPSDLWVRSASGAGSIIDRQIFDRAQKIIAERYVSISEDEMLKRLRIVLGTKGRLTESLINSTPSLPNANVYVNHFGSIRHTYALIGYKTPHDCTAMDAHDHWETVLAEHARQLATELGIDPNLVDDRPALPLGDNCTVQFRTARSKRSKPHEWRHTIGRRRQAFLRCCE